MKKLLLIFLAAIALPTTVNAEEKVKPSVSNFSYVLYKHLELGFDLGYSINRTSLLYKDDDADLYKCIGDAKNNWERGKLFSFMQVPSNNLVLLPSHSLFTATRSNSSMILRKNSKKVTNLWLHR